MRRNATYYTFNRTILELKAFSARYKGQKKQLLIVPYWN